MSMLKAGAAGAKALFGRTKSRLSSMNPKKGLEFFEEGLLGSRIKDVPGHFKKHPLITTGFGMGLGSFLLDEVAKPIYGTLNPEEQLAEAIKQDRHARMVAQVEVATGEQLRKRMMESAARLAAVDPQLYNEVMAGRKLPMGAAVFGGVPRTDLMDELALDMAQGRFQTPANPDDELLRILGASQ